jgi:hypothetical protein
LSLFSLIHGRWHTNIGKYIAAPAYTFWSVLIHDNSRFLLPAVYCTSLKSLSCFLLCKQPVNSFLILGRGNGSTNFRSSEGQFFNVHILYISFCHTPNSKSVMPLKCNKYLQFARLWDQLFRWMLMFNNLLPRYV